MPNRLSQSKPQPQRLKIPEGHRIVWVPKHPKAEPPATAPKAAPTSKESTADEIGPVEKAQLVLQRQRLEEGGRPAEVGEGFIDTPQPAHDARTRGWIEEQRQRLNEPK